MVYGTDIQYSTDNLHKFTFVKIMGSIWKSKEGQVFPLWW